MNSESTNVHCPLNITFINEEDVDSIYRLKVNKETF